MKITKTDQTRPFLDFTKKTSTLPRVVWAEKSKAGLRFEIGPSYDVVPTGSQLVTHGKPSCSNKECALYFSNNPRRFKA